MCYPTSAAWARVDGHWYLPYEQPGRVLDFWVCIESYFLHVVAFESCKRREGKGGRHHG